MNHLLSPSELILNPDGSVYHLNILPEHLADTVILVGDPDRADIISAYFDRKEFSRQKREFVTHTGFIGSKRISVVSTGIGTDNIDIVLSELDILASIDLKNRKPLDSARQLSMVRLGTSGGLQADIKAGEILVSSMAVGLDNLMGFYRTSPVDNQVQLKLKLQTHLMAHGINLPAPPYIGSCSWKLNHDFREGITLTCPGFYGPQGRNLKNKAAFPGILDAFASMPAYNGHLVTNLEMETAGIYAMSSMLGHRAVSVSVILANRSNGSFSTDPSADVRKMIESVLPLIV